MKRFLLWLYRRAPWRALNRWLGYSERRRLLDAALETQRTAMRGRVLEIGAGRAGRRGRFAPPVEDAEQWITLDVNPQQSPHVVGDVLALPFPSGAFDTVLCLEVLEYVGDLLPALAEMRRMLEPSGVLILSMPFLHRADTPSDTWRLTENGLRRLLSEAGFTLEEVIPQGAALAVAANILKYVVHLIRFRPLRIVCAALAWLPLMLLRWLDAPLAARQPILKTYSTGYLLRARVDRGEDAHHAGL
ncbi:MAG TPA: class I SAM-dependent methyltransferase [Chloroflexi bacterium]|nr:class I SAM-dependent methyltransferase [Chloroflexota bacterium]